jgi:RNA polymerase sigma-70 factor (ECF subfamily)
MTNPVSTFSSYLSTADHQAKLGGDPLATEDYSDVAENGEADTPVQNMSASTNNEKFSALWQQAEISVIRYVIGLVGRRSAADDIVQEVAYICLKQWATYDPSRNFTAWALGIARLEIFTHRRRNILLPISEMPELEVIVGDPERSFKKQRDVRQQALILCMNNLADHQKRLLEQRYGRNHSYEEMSDTLRVQINSLKAMLSRIRKLLRACINERLTKSGNL